MIRLMESIWSGIQMGVEISVVFFISLLGIGLAIVFTFYIGNLLGVNW